MKRPNGKTVTVRSGIVSALKLRIALSTDALCEWSAKSAGFGEELYSTPQWKGSVYRAAAELEKRGTLVSAKIYNGKAYERVWRLK